MRSLFASIALATSLVPAIAHEQRVGPRGGALVDAGTYHVELVTRDKAIEIFVSDAQDKPLPANGFKALAILAVSGKSVRVTLEPAPDGSKLIGAAAESLPARVKGAVQLTGADGKTSTGRIN
ncbi:hypothetical protein [Rhabdaerophilum sp. SD176]|uniref:hypothetical protein n=1 Tax=Rhabdaerophilum sp. SD176 TaxID=2983548 RepID=UPI0024DFBD3A|nr:hypothetical protein [Rhabdaerophilum sp. SD176]